MPRPEQTPTPAFERGSELPQGVASEVNEAAAGALPEEDLFAFLGGEDLLEGEEAEEDFAPEGDEDAFLFSESDRPSEPITQGAPFGPGVDLAKRSFETDDEFRGRLAAELSTSESPEVRAVASKLLRGL